MTAQFVSLFASVWDGENKANDVFKGTYYPVKAYV